jgi:Fe-S-cluster containining protein
MEIVYSPTMEMKHVNLRSFRRKAKLNRSRFRRFLTRIEKAPPRGLPTAVTALEKQVWLQTDCLSCANCCKTMTPTFTTADIKRISAHLGMTKEAFREKWLKRERGGDRDWVNKVEPCQFLNLKDNKCSIYEVRPADCSGFPHLAKDFQDFVHVHKQNVELCPASYRLVELMINKYNNSGSVISA